MGPTEDNNQGGTAGMAGAGAPADGGAAMPPAQDVPPTGGTDQGAGAAWPPAPAAPDPGATATPNPEDVSMGEEASAAPAMPSMPPASAPDAGAAPAPEDPNGSMPGAAPQQ